MALDKELAEKLGPLTLSKLIGVLRAMLVLRISPESKVWAILDLTDKMVAELQKPNPVEARQSAYEEMLLCRGIDDLEKVVAEQKAEIARMKEVQAQLFEITPLSERQVEFLEGLDLLAEWTNQQAKT